MARIVWCAGGVVQGLCDGADSAVRGWCGVVGGLLCGRCGVRVAWWVGGVLCRWCAVQVVWRPGGVVGEWRGVRVVWRVGGGWCGSRWLISDHWRWWRAGALVGLVRWWGGRNAEGGQRAMVCVSSP